jgi:streptogramin lyase
MRIRGRIVSVAVLVALLVSVADATGASAKPVITEYPIPSGNHVCCETSNITVGPDGAIWFVEPVANQLGRLDGSGIVTEIGIPGFIGQPLGITTGPDGNLWFTEWNGSIGRLQLPGTWTQFLTGFTGPHTITAGPDGNVWFTGQNASNIWRITPDGTITAFPFPGTYNTASITTGPDGNIWFTETDLAGNVWRMTPSGVATRFSGRGQPEGIAAGPDGNLWYADFVGNDIQRITPDGVITEFHLPNHPQPFDIVAGPDGNMWFTELASPGGVNRITTAGQILGGIPTPTPQSQPEGIVAGTARSLWFVEEVGNIGRVSNQSG